MSDVNEITTPDIDLSEISDGVNYLKDGYIEYCEEVIVNRALPNLYDGLKPVNRRILYTLFHDKVKSYMKSARVAGNVLALHPHGDSSVYQAMVLMTQKNGSLAFPTVDGSGTFGGVYKTDPAAASRYTEVKLHSNTDEYFGELNGINMIPNYDSTMEEPELLPVSFPAVLVNSTTGIAVGFRSNVPSFNFIDVCNLVKEYATNGECKTVIAPDFVTGGYYVKDEKELLKLMQGGVARIKLRGKYVVSGKEIQITEIPYGKTIQGLVKQIDDKDISSIRNAYDTDDFEHGILITIDCKSKARVDEAAYSVIRDTDFQYTYSADITVVEDGVPVRKGVWEIVKDWTEWRKGVLTKEFNHRLENLKQAIRESEAFINLVKDREKCLKLVETITKEGRQAGREYLRKAFTREEIPEDLIKFVSGRSLPDYHTGGVYLKNYESYKVEINTLEVALADLNKYICDDMDRLIKTYGKKMERRTEVTTKDYNFTTKASEEKVDDSVCYYALKNGFIRKCSRPINDPDALNQFEGQANDKLFAIDSKGRILRINGSDLNIGSPIELGTFIPRYCGITDTNDDYKINYLGKIDGREVMLLYKDGNVGFIDTSEWLNNTRFVKVLEKGISVSSAGELGAVLDNIPEVLYTIDTDSRFAWTIVKDIKRKARTAKTRVFNLGKNRSIKAFAGMSAMHGMLALNNASEYQDHYKLLPSREDLRVELSTFKVCL